MVDEKPRWRRRKDARPAEILEAALGVFAEKGFAAARLDEIARRAGVSKAALYLYFETKEDLFRAAVRSLMAPNLAVIASAVEALDIPFSEAAPLLLARAATVLGDARAVGLAKMVIGESGNFPDLARIWRDDVVERVIGMVSGLISRAQAKGEIAAGDPRLYFFSLMGPMVLGALFNAVFGPVTPDRCDLEQLAAQHAGAILSGLARPVASAREL